jgi:hypothetical protein
MDTKAATWPDITCAIRVLSRYIHDSSNEHMIAVKLVLCYLNGMKDWRLHFGETVRVALRDRTLGGEEEGGLRCFIDSDPAGYLDDYQST